MKTPTLTPATTPLPTAPAVARSVKPKLRTRAISVGHLRAFEAVARHLNFRVAS